MIIKSFEVNKLNLNKNPFVLLYGKNDGLKKEIKKNILKNKIITSNYEEKEIIDNFNNFIEELNTKSLFEEEKLITINRASDKILKILSEIIDKNNEDLIIIVDAENLEKKSKLRSFFEKEINCACIPVYPDTQTTLSKIAFDYLNKRKIPISSSNVNTIINRCNGDRKILLMELEKIEIFAKEGKKITAENIAKLTNLVENHSISELVDNCLAKNKHKTINILVENNFSNEDCVQITRIFLNKLKKILKLSTEYQKNKDLDLTISLAKPPIFWKEKEITKQQIINSNPEKLRRSLFKVNEIELLIKKNYENSINLITDFIMTQLSIRVNN
jgi:DNA polymerase-3 subunit delta